MWDHPVLGNHYDPVSNEVIRMVHVIGLARGRDYGVVPNARILVHDGIFDTAVGADANAVRSGFFVAHDRVVGLIEIAAQQNGAIENAAGADVAADTDDTMAYDRVVEYAAVRDDCMIYLRAVDFGPRQEARPAEN